MLQIRNIRKSFGSQLTLDDINLDIGQGEFFSLLGPSGCGKTTLLRILAGLETQDSGQLLLSGTDIARLTPQQRPFNMVFQKYALFPHMTVFQNIAFGLKIRKLKALEIKARVDEVLSLVNLTSFADRLPETLSGGQAQRVALARALVNRPQILLLDEPLSALDQQLRKNMQNELRQLQKKLGMTFIFVTHDQEEAFAMSDRVAVMNKGRIEQVSSPFEIYENPKSRFTAGFIGEMNSLKARVLNADQEFATLQVAGGHKIRGKCFHSMHSTQSAEILIRPEKVSLHNDTTQHPDGLNLIDCEMQEMIFKGSALELLVHFEQKPMRVLLPYSQNHIVRDLKPGQKIQLRFCPTDTFVFSEAAMEN